MHDADPQVILWKNDRRVSARNITEYHVDVKTSVPVLNLFIGQFGGFPQDLCYPGGSKARDAVNVEGSSGTCSPYMADDHRNQRTASFEIPSVLRKIAKWDVVVTVRGYGTHAPPGRPSERVPATWWCHTYRRPPLSPSPADAEDASAQAERSSKARGTSWGVKLVKRL